MFFRSLFNTCQVNQISTDELGIDQHLSTLEEIHWESNRCRSSVRHRRCRAGSDRRFPDWRENGVTRKCFVFGQIEFDGRERFLLGKVIEPVIAFLRVRGETLPISIISEKNEHRALIVTLTDQILDLACWQLHLQFSHSHECRPDQQDHRIVRHWAHRRDQSRIFTDLWRRTQRVTLLVVVLRVDNLVEVLLVNKRAEEKFERTREIHRHTIAEQNAVVVRLTDRLMFHIHSKAWWRSDKCQRCSRLEWNRMFNDELCSSEEWRKRSIVTSKIWI